MRLQWLQFACRAVIAGVMPAQKRVASVRAIMEVTPWCAECRMVRMCGRSEGGMTMQSLWRMTPSTVYRCSQN